MLLKKPKEYYHIRKKATYYRTLRKNLIYIVGIHFPVHITAKKCTSYHGKVTAAD